MAKYIVDYNVKRQNSNQQRMIPAWKLASELGLVFPLFIAIFFPRARDFYHGFLKNLVDEIPTWCHNLYLHNCSEIDYASDVKWKGMCITWNDYKIIKQRWVQFDKIKKKIITKQNQELLKVFPFLPTLFSVDQRKRLGPYVGFKTEYFAEIFKLDCYRQYRTEELRCQLLVVDIRFMKEKNDILSSHFVFTLSANTVEKYLKDVMAGDTIRFNAVAEKYENPLHNIERIELTKFKLLEIFPKE